MNCGSCAHENRDAARFCEACGERLVETCASCNTELRAGANFCDACGAAAGTTRERPPADYTPRHLAAKILQSKSVLEGEMKQVTVMFADVKSSMELAEQLGAETWHGTLDRFFQLLADGVHRFEGTVNQYTGDGIMALFGAPISHENHAQRACYSALHLRNELREFTREIKRQHGVDFAVRIGLNSGDVVVGKIGDDLRMDYTAQGHTVGLAQRMESLASGGSAYLSQATASLVEDYFELEDLGEFSVKGASEPLRVFELAAAGAARTRFDVSRDRGLTSFVGRSDETALLDTALEQALGGPGRTVGVVAQAGTGKSRLCYEFVESCRRRGITVYEARGLSHGAHIPLLPVQELLRDFFGIDERDSERVVREKIAGRTLLLDETLGEELPIFFDLLGVPDPARPLPEVDPDVMRRRMYAALRAIVRTDGEVDPGVLLVEDLHWLDPASDSVLAQIIEANAESRSLVLVNFRPEYQAHWMQQSHYQRLSLLPLSQDALQELLRDLLGEHPSVAELPQTIYARTGGNPFFIEEVVQSLIEDGHLEGSKGAYRLTTRVDRLPMPETVQALLAARIDRLAEREKHVLQSASVIGKNFPERVLERVVELPEDELAAALRVLQNAELVYEAALYPEHEYAFKHPLTQEVAEQSQLAERRARRHAAVASAYEALDPERLDDRAALLAHHWEHAEEPGRAAHWHARAAGRMGSTDYREAYAHWMRVDELIQQDQGPESEALQTRSFIELTLGAFRVEVPKHDADEIFARGRSFLEARGDHANLARLTSAYSAVLQNRGHMVDYLELATQAMEAARRVGDPAVLAYCGLERCYALMQRGALADSVAAGDEIVELANGDIQLGAEVGYSPLITCLAFTVGPLAHMGRLQEGEERLEAALRLARDHAGAETLVWLTFQQIEVALARGDGAQALRRALHCRTLAERSGSAFDDVASRCWLAMTYADLEDWQQCAAEMQEARAASERCGLGKDILISTSWAHARALLGLGEIERARELADAAIEICTEQQTWLHLCRCLIVRAAVHRASAREAEAEADLESAERLVEKTGARLFQGQILEARCKLREALSLYEELGATGHAERLRRISSA